MPQPIPTCVRMLTVAIGALALATPVCEAQLSPISLELLDHELGSQRVRARTLSATGLVVLDEMDIPRLRGWGEVLVALQRDNPGHSAAVTEVPGPDLVGWAVLSDGQRHRVWPNPPSSANPDVLDVTLLDGTEWSIPLEQLRALVFWAQPGDEGPGYDDTVRLANGDAITGFVESIGDTVIVDSTRVPLDRVASISLANPAEPATVMLIDLADGSVVGATGIGPTDHGLISIQLSLSGSPDGGSSPRISVEPQDILAIRPVSALTHLVPMASLEPVSVVPLGGRRWTPPPRASDVPEPAGLRSIELPGPMEVVYDLPRGARAWRAEPWLGSDVWAEATLEVLAELPGGERVPVARVEMTDGGAGETLHARLPEDAVRMVIRLTAGERGPIQDRVVLRYPVLVVEH